MLIVQNISLVWTKETRGAAFAQKRAVFPQAYPYPQIPFENCSAIVIPFHFVQQKDGIVPRTEFLKQTLFKSLKEKGVPQSEICKIIQKRLSLVNGMQKFSAVQEISLQNISLTPEENKLQVCFFWNRQTGGKPFRRGHNKDWDNPKSLFYQQDCVNEVAFCLQPEQYGRIVWNERKTDADTGGWYYLLHIYNLFWTKQPCCPKNIFEKQSPDFVYRQLAKLS